MVKRTETDIEKIRLLTDLLDKAGLCQIDQTLPATRKVLDLIPPDNLSCIVALIRLLSSAQEGLLKKLLDDKVKTPQKILRSIDKTLSKAREEEWLTDSGLAEIKKAIKTQMIFSKSGSNYVASRMIKQLRRTGGREIKNPYLKAFILFLSGLIKSKTGKYHDDLIADFLSEQSLGKDVISGDAIKLSRRQRTKSSKAILSETKRMRFIWSLIAFPSEVQKHPNPEEGLTQELIEIMLAHFN